MLSISPGANAINFLSLVEARLFSAWVSSLRSAINGPPAHSPRYRNWRKMMAKKNSRGRKQDRARVASEQEVRYEAKKMGKSKAKLSGQ
jgi:hypothetical protein